MTEEIQMYLDDAREKMNNAISYLDGEFSKIRAGRANVHMLDGVKIDYYGTLTPLQQVSNLGIPDPRTIAIQPWDRNVIDLIEKAILSANLGLNPVNNGEIIRINIPPLTEERRVELVKQVKNEGENSKVSIRNIRRDTNEEFKKLQKEGLSEDLEKDAEGEVQKLTDEFINKINEKIENKEKDIMTV
ncbi:ribosome recycling factor [Bacteroidota bacterium]